MKYFILSLGDIFNVAPRKHLSSRKKLLKLYAENEERTIEGDMKRHFYAVGQHIFNACNRYADPECQNLPATKI